jgi:hypothetical protein
MNIRKFKDSGRCEVIALWERCKLVRPQNDTDRDIDLKVSFQSEMFFVGFEYDSLVAAVMADYEGRRGGGNYLADDLIVQHSGNGVMKSHAEGILKNLGGVKLNLQMRSINSVVLGIYDSICYIKDDRAPLGRHLS